MATMKTGMICYIRGSNDDCRVIGTRVEGLVFRGGIKGTADQTSSCQHPLSKKLVPDYTRFRIEIKYLYP